MKYIFIDTNLFVDAITSNESESILNTMFRVLNKRNTKFVLPEVIKMEILTQYHYWAKGVVDSVKVNLETKKILGINEVLTDTEKKSKKKQKGETESEKINSLVESHRNEMIKQIEKYYKSTLRKTEQIFKHKNTELVKLTDQILLAGMRRSLLKKSPYTRVEKITESAHTKDVDCIAFEALVAFYEKQNNKRDKNILIMCVSDKDYFSADNVLHDDIRKDIDVDIRCYKNLPDMLNNEFEAQVGYKKGRKIKNAENTSGSLASGNGVLIESSRVVVP